MRSFQGRDILSLKDFEHEEFMRRLDGLKTTRDMPATGPRR
jgi:hypothetical protein